MGVVVGNTGDPRMIKPEPWPWKPSSVRPEWQWFLRDLTFAAPLWKDYKDYSSGITGTPGFGTGFSTSATGTSYENAEDEILRFGSNGTNWRPAGANTGFSIAVAFHQISNMDGFISFGIMGQRSSLANGAWFLFRPGFSDDLRFAWTNGSPLRAVNFDGGWDTYRPVGGIPSPETSTLRSYCMTRATTFGGSFELFVQGQFFGTKLNGVPFSTANTHELVLGSLGADLPNHGIICHWMTAYIWQRTLTSHEAIMISADPYGPWRPPRTFLD